MGTGRHSDPPTNALFVFGGERPSNRGDENVENIAAPMLLETDLMLWYAPSTYGKAPSGRAGHSATFINGCVVIFGGCVNRKWLNEVFVLDLSRWHWSEPRTLGVAPAFRSYHTATPMGKKIVFFGGNNGQKTFDDVFTLDVSTWAVRERGSGERERDRLRWVQRGRRHLGDTENRMRVWCVYCC